MIRVMIESPYAGDIQRNTNYAIEAMRHSLEHGEAPFAAHLLYPRGVLDESDPKERARGLQAAWEWMAVCDVVAFYIDYGWSPGMIKALKVARLLPKQVTTRLIFGQATVREHLNVRELLEHMEIAGLRVVEFD